jgi:uncharacterized membrane protein
MIVQGLISTIGVLAAATTHHRRGAFVAVIVLVIIIALAYYAWHQRKLRQRAENERR